MSREPNGKVSEKMPDTEVVAKAKHRQYTVEYKLQILRELDGSQGIVETGAWLIADKAYTDYVIEEVINESEMRMRPIRKRNLKRPFEPWIFYLQSTYRKIIETSISLVERLLPKHIHSVTSKGFELKVGLFVLASSINALG